MRWEDLFADMEAQLEEAARADLRSRIGELTRAERAGVALVDRVRGSSGAPLRVTLRGGEVVHGVVTDSASQWFLLAPGPSRRVLVPATAVAAVTGLRAAAAPPPGVVERRLTLGHALRALSRDRDDVTLVADGFEVGGRLERVGSDHVDVTPTGAAASATVAVTFAALRAVRSR